MTGSLSRRIILGFFVLLALAATAVGLQRVSSSSATFTTVSQTGVGGRADRTSDWVHLWSQSTDPDALGGYAVRRLADPPTPAATGRDEGLTVDLGGYPDFKQDFLLSRVFTLETPATFPDPAVAGVTVTATLLPDAGGAQPLRKLTITDLGGAGRLATATLAPGEKRQLNVTVRSKRNFEVGRTYHPHVVLTVTFAGGPVDYYVYDIPMAFTDAGE